MLCAIVEINSYALGSQCKIDRRLPPDVLGLTNDDDSTTSASFVQPLLFRLLLRLRFSPIDEFGWPYDLDGDGERLRLRPRRPRVGLELFARFFELRTDVVFSTLFTG